MNSLKELDLSENSIEDIKEFHNMNNLEELDLSGNSIEDIKGFERQYMLGKLELLDLNYNSFNGIIPSLGFLITQDFKPTGINLNGSIDIGGWCELSNLQELDLSENGFTGMLPSCLGDLTSIRILDLSFNQFTGNLTLSPLSNLTTLEYLILSYNHFEIPVTFISFCNHSKLKANFQIAYLFLLLWKHLVLATTTCAKASKMDGNMSNLMGIAMFSNHFEGPIPVEFCKLGNLEFLDLSENNLSGFIPSCFNQLRVKHVHLNRNQLNGPMTRAFYNSSSLVTLDLSDNHLNGTIPRWIGSLPMLSIFLLKFNNFEGEVPVQSCQLKQLSILDLSENNFFGSIPPCFHEIPFETTHEKSSLETGYQMGGISTFSLWSFVEGSKSLGEHYMMDVGYGTIIFHSLDVQQKVELTTKHGSYAYKGNILDYMSGVDLSCNHLKGEIPLEMGNLSNIHVLNLSHNNLFGLIPSTFSQLKQIESLDLSYNRLNGKIPSQLIELDKLEVFSVAYNNLSGATPDRKAQFATFEESSYEGNLFLCGLPLRTNCNKTVPTSTMSKGLERKIEDDGFIDMEIFYVSFLVSYIIALSGIVAILFINPHWRQAWFHLVEVCMTSWYYFFLDNVIKFFCNRSM
ncbi:Receptor-like protein 15 [Camellia lanceoleosa]|uniref:Receptor-like protein 15 n=1 Tax=Camellia lanceoleosa TaxID=1840588 RepID=A0ACC0IGY3_9ERIC|nr:Receptor-like protein 15 [Camellia lanceoleosa]